MIITGTRVTDRTVAESTAPIDIITPEVLQTTGTTDLATALARALSSLNVPRVAIADGSHATRPAQLRGLAPDHVLVLVNGKRYHTGALVKVNGTQGRSSAPVDLNTIPVARSRASKCCATARRRSTARMRSPADQHRAQDRRVAGIPGCFPL